MPSIHSGLIFMAFNLQKVLKALLFSTAQPLSVKDIQAAFTRFHEQATLQLVETEEGEGDVAPTEETAAAPAQEAPEALGVAAGVETLSSEATGEAPPEIDPLALAPEDPELYQDVPSLVTATQIREAMDAIAAELKGSDCGLLLIEGRGGFQLVTEPKFARWLRILRNEPPPVKLSQSALETLAVVAYRQPVTKTEIEQIRGVSAEAGVNKLLERELVYIVGRADLPGRPLQYGTTDKFLEFVGVKSLEELPASDVLSNRQIDEWLQKTSATKPPSDEDMGLPLEMENGANPQNAPSETAASAEAQPEVSSSDVQASPEAATAPAPEPQPQAETAPAPEAPRTDAPAQ